MSLARAEYTDHPYRKYYPWSVPDSVEYRLLRLQLQQSRLQSPTSTETDSLIDNSSNAKIESSADQESNTSEADNDNWKLAFTAGLLSGGILLRLLRPVLERHLGVPIFDKAVIEGTSSTPLLTFLVGTLVGVGTKVISTV